MQLILFHNDFYVIDMENDMHEAPILLGRPFIKTARTRIDCVTKTLSMEFCEDKVEFDLYDTMKHPTQVHSLCLIDVIKPAKKPKGPIVFHLPAFDFDIDKSHTDSSLSTNLQGRMPKLEEKGKSPIHPLGIGPTLLTTSDRLTSSVLQKAKVKQKYPSGRASEMVRTKLWWMPKRAKEPPEVE